MPPDHRALEANLLFASFSPEDGAHLATSIRVEWCAPGRVFINRAKEAREVWFPLSGVAALSVTDNEGRSVQTGIVGPEGCFGLNALFSSAATPGDAAVQVAGEFAAVPAAYLRHAAETRVTIMPVLTRFLYEMSAQALQTVACNRLHSLECRSCRWLLMLQDRTGQSDLPLTQESFATLLGSGRPRINGLLASLEQDGLLRRYRGRIRILTRQGLRARACECYRPLHPW